MADQALFLSVEMLKQVKLVTYVHSLFGIHFNPYVLIPAAYRSLQELRKQILHSYQTQQRFVVHMYFHYTV